MYDGILPQGSDFLNILQGKQDDRGDPAEQGRDMRPAETFFQEHGPQHKSPDKTHLRDRQHHGRLAVIQ